MKLDEKINVYLFRAAMSSDKSNTIKVIPPAPAAATTHKAAESKKQRVTELKNSEVRWFMRRDPDSKWTPFNGYNYFFKSKIFYINQ